MSSKFVRSSKYRHIFGKEGIKTDEVFLNCDGTSSAWDSNQITANNKYWAMLWKSGGNTAVTVWDHSKKGKLPQGDGLPKVGGHKQAVLDLKFNPFNENILATCSEDWTTMLWKIPTGGLTELLTEPVQTLKGHKRKVGQIEFHPTSSNVMASTSLDYTMKVWDIESGKPVKNIEGAKDHIQNFAWNADGSLVGLTCKDKILRVTDPRTEAYELTTAGHDGIKGCRCVWLGDKLFTVGFSKRSEREYKIWDPKNFEKPIMSTAIDTQSGIIIPFYDQDTTVLYLVGRGDGNIRYYEFTNDDKMLYFLSDFKSNNPARGACMLPKTACNVSSCEVSVIYKIVQSKKSVVPISFTVPRKSEFFQEDIFPDTASGAGEPGQDLAAYLEGTNVSAPKVNLENAFVPVEKPDVNFEKQVVEAVKGPASEAELRKEWEALTNRVTYLEAEIKKKDLTIKELEGKLSA